LKPTKRENKTGDEGKKSRKTNRAAQIQRKKEKGNDRQDLKVICYSGSDVM
jgi:hypothetical protein